MKTAVLPSTEMEIVHHYHNYFIYSAIRIPSRVFILIEIRIPCPRVFLLSIHPVQKHRNEQCKNVSLRNHTKKQIKPN